MCLDGEDHNAIGYIMKFDSKIPHSELKACLLGQNKLKSKRIKFYQMFRQHVKSNHNFISAMRFYLYSGDLQKLRKCVEPEIPETVKLEEIMNEKRKIKFLPDTLSFEQTVLEFILLWTHMKLQEYPTRLEEDEKFLNENKEKLEYKKICCLKEIIGEKKSIKVLMEMCEISLCILNAPTKEMAMKMYYKQFSETNKRPYFSYIEEDLFKLKWT